MRNFFSNRFDDATTLVRLLIFAFQSWPARLLAATFVPRLVVVLVWGQQLAPSDRLEGGLVL